MTYRDDLEAAQARADAAERRATELEQKLGEQATEQRIVTIPDQFELTSTESELSIRWRWRDGSHEYLFAVGLLLLAGAVYAWRAGSWVFGAIGLGLAWWGARGLVNHTTVSVRGDTLSVRHGPLPGTKGFTFPVADVVQLFLEKNDDLFGMYNLCVVLTGDRMVRLVTEILHHREAQYLEQAFEQRLRINDRPVVGEAPK